MTDPPVEAAGAVVWRSVSDRLEVLLVHRDRYDDWTFPKGKLDPSETAPAAAVREVAEETGVRIRLGPRLVRHEYRLTRPPGVKQVTYWCATPVSPGAARAADAYEPNAEIDGVRWLDLERAAGKLTYARDGAVLEEFGRAVDADLHRSTPLIVLRHDDAESRKTWSGGDDTQRPLSPTGRRQAELAVPLLSAFDVRSAVTSDAKRCVKTVQPYVDTSGRTRRVKLVLAPELSEEHATRHRVRDCVEPLLARKKRVVVCTHRPVLPWVFEALKLPEVKLSPGQMVVVHRFAGRVLASELLSA